MKALVFFALLFLSSVVIAQPAGGGPVTPTPIGFTELLMVGAVGLGAVKKYRNRKMDN